MTTLTLMEIKELPNNAIEDQLTKSRLELVNLRMKFVTRQLEDTSLLKQKRKEIARLLTVQTLNSKEKKDKPEVKAETKAKKLVKKKIEKKTVAKKGKK